MNTLHMYHWRDIKTVDENLKLMGPFDSLVIYGKLTNHDLLLLESRFESIKNDCYVVNKHHNPNIALRNINHSQWLDLIIKHINTLAWK